jgi:hypothetical protein
MENDFSKKPIAILLHGSSIKLLEENIDKFQDLDFIFCSLNYFSILEENILKKINKSFNIIYCSSSAEFLLRKNDIEEFLNRDNTIFVTTPQTIWETETEDFFNKYNKKIYLTKLHLYRSDIYPNSITILLLYLIRYGARKIAIFGYDGIGQVNYSEIQDTYYEKEKFLKDRNWNLVADTYNFNKYFSELLYKLFDENQLRQELDIINFSRNSYIETFTKLSLDNLRIWYDSKTLNPSKGEMQIFSDELNVELLKYFQLYKDKDAFTTKVQSLIKEYKPKLKGKEIDLYNKFIGEHFLCQSDMIS